MLDIRLDGDGRKTRFVELNVSAGSAFQYLPNEDSERYYNASSRHLPPYHGYSASR